MKKIIISSLIIIVLLIILLIFFIPSKKQEFENLGIEFYTNFYYPTIDGDSKKVILDSIKENGLQLTLNDLIFYQDKYTEKEISSRLQKCDKEKSIIYIYPIEPYDIKDYKVKTDLVC